ncbi:MAG: hypothetical protein FJX34_00985 [Alphaproteobacteria bacterium]|nr:hypothetical protein [Alphaproteobacteria bacterium]
MKALVKLVTLLIVAALGYSGFWFFKIGQVQKQLNKFMSENSSYISAGDIEVAGFPLAQKITIKNLKFTIPNAALDNRQIMVQSLEAKARVFSADYAVTIPESVLTVDSEGNNSAVEFSQAPEITASILDGRITKFHYHDSGYKIIDLEKVVIYSASASEFAFESSGSEQDKIINKITANIKDIEGFDVVVAYKNALEKRVVDGLKTGEISLGNNIPVTEPTAVPTATPAPVAAPTPAQADAATSIPAVITDTSIVKGNLILDVEYALTPVAQAANPQAATTPPDPTQIQEVPAQYSKVVKISNLEFSNPLYKITVSGEMQAFSDDNFPSGGLTVKVESISNLVNQLTTNLTQMADKVKPAPTPTAPAAETPVDASAQPQQPIAVADASIPQVAAAEDPYQIFLKRVSIGLPAIAKEIAARNAVSKDEVAQFDIRREKNLDFLINETSVHEILGKF